MNFHLQLKCKKQKVITTVSVTNFPVFWGTKTILSVSVSSIGNIHIYDFMADIKCRNQSLLTLHIYILSKSLSCMAGSLGTRHLPMALSSGT